MEIQRANSLGALPQQLGIDANARVSYEFTATGLVIQDLSTGVRYMVGEGQVTKSQFEVPKSVQEIVAATDANLKQRWNDGSGWTDERQTIFTELTYRGVRILDFPKPAFG